MYGRFILGTLAATVSIWLLVLWINDPLPAYNGATSVAVPDGLVLPSSDAVQAYVTTDDSDKVAAYFTNYFSQHWGWQQQFTNVSCNINPENPKYSFVFTRFGKQVTIHGFTADEANSKGFKNVPLGGTAFIVISH